MPVPHRLRRLLAAALPAIIVVALTACSNAQYPSQGNGKLDTLTTANELYLPIGRTVNFALTTQDVLHSFWIPQMGGKRDLITNRVNHLWFTPDSVGEGAWNGFCAEYCGTSHGNMHFKTFTVTKANFESWAAHQLSPAAFGAVAAAPVTPAATDTIKPVQVPSEAVSPGKLNQIAVTPTGTKGGAVAAVSAAQTPAGPNIAAMPVQQGGFVAFPKEKLPAHTIPRTPIPDGLAYNESLHGDTERGRALLTAGQRGWRRCHLIRGNTLMVRQHSPNLTHIGSRTTIAGGIYPHDTKHLALWIKKARALKPGVVMPTLGKGQLDPVTKATMAMGLTDEQIADIVAYLQALK